MDRNRLLGRSASEDNDRISLSNQTRREDALALLNLLYVKLGDLPIDCAALNCVDAVYAAVQNTSWEELVSEGLLTKRGNSLYFFTAKGWSEALSRY
jgi:hypothetical protein